MRAGCVKPWYLLAMNEPDQKCSPSALSTVVNHPPRISLEAWNRPLTDPIYQTVKFATGTSEQKHSAEHETFLYTRAGNPSLRQLEKLLAEVQGCEDGVVFASGMGAISAVLLALLDQGDHVVVLQEAYLPSRSFIRTVLSRFGVNHTLVSLASPGSIEQAIVPGKTKLVFFESISNPMVRMSDVAAIAEVARRMGVLSVVDNTFAGIHQLGGLGVDVFVHSLTKFVNGHGDVLAGGVFAKSELIERIRPLANLLGATLDPHAAFLVMRGMKTYPLRFEQHSRSALKVAEWLERHPKVEKVFYPGLPSDPCHELAKRQLNGFGGVVSMNLRDQDAESFTHRLKIFQPGTSLGSNESLATAIEFLYARDLTAEQRRAQGISGRSVRLSIGLEAAEDLIRDLDAAL